MMLQRLPTLATPASDCREVAPIDQGSNRPRQSRPISDASGRKVTSYSTTPELFVSVVLRASLNKVRHPSHLHIQALPVPCQSCQEWNRTSQLPCEGPCYLSKRPVCGSHRAFVIR